MCCGLDPLLPRGAGVKQALFLGKNVRTVTKMPGTDPQTEHWPGHNTHKTMKKTIGWLTISIFVFAAFRSTAQTITNVDYLTLRVQIALMCLTNADSGGDVAETGSARLNSKDIIQLLSEKLSFTLNKFTNGNGIVAPQRGP